MLVNKLVVEFLGTMFLVYVIFAFKNWMAIGLALGIAILLGGGISGGAFNPAVAIALYAAGKVSKEELLPYILVEILGALAGGYAALYFLSY